MKTVFVALLPSIFIFWSWAILFSFIGSSAVCAIENSHKTPLTIGIPDTLVNPQDVIDLRQTLNALQKGLPQYSLKIKTFSAADGLDSLKTISPEFILAPSGFFSTLDEKAEQTAYKVATRINLKSSDPEQSVGAALAVLSERKDLRILSDLKNKTAQSGLPNSIDSWLSIRNELRLNHYDDEKFFSKLTFSNNAYPDVLSALLNKKVDVGILPACLLEELESKGLIEGGLIKIINQKSETPLRCKHSTDLFPDISLWALENTPREEVKDLTMALYNADEELGRQWVPNVSERRMLELFKRLEEGPYRYLRDFTPKALYERHKQAVWFLGLLLFILLINELRLNVLIKKRTALLANALLERDIFEAKAIKVRKVLNAYEKRSVVQQMSGMIAHELSSPLGGIRTYATLLKMEEISGKSLSPDVRQKAIRGIEEQVLKISEIIDRVRGYAKNNRSGQVGCNLVQLFDKAKSALIAERGRTAEEKILFTSCAQKALVKGNALELEILFLNILRNALVSCNFN